MNQTQCRKCVMDKSAEEITFDKQGVCNFCREMEREMIEISKLHLPKIVAEIKLAGEGKKYDVLIGLSGGVDSSWALHCAIQLGLRPLCFSVDNGWNSPEADENIMRLVETLKVPFYRYTIDLNRFKDLQAAFIKAGLINIEIPTDHVLMATTYEMAAKHDIKYILSGGNVATEGIMPSSWSYNARDLVHIKDVYRKMMHKELEGLPVCSLAKWNYYRWIKKIKITYLLDYLQFDRNEAAAELTKIYGWKEYGQKHCESTFTWWFQSHYLFQKFGIDKRKAFFSALINSGQMTRQEALDALGQELLYPRIGLEQKIMKYPQRKHEEFAHDNYNTIAKFVRLWR